jgi:hypothetical protein
MSQSSDPTLLVINHNPAPVAEVVGDLDIEGSSPVGDLPEASAFDPSGIVVDQSQDQMLIENIDYVDDQAMTIAEDLPPPVIQTVNGKRTLQPINPTIVGDDGAVILAPTQPINGGIVADATDEIDVELKKLYDSGMSGGMSTSPHNQMVPNLSASGNSIKDHASSSSIIAKAKKYINNSF